MEHLTHSTLPFSKVNFLGGDWNNLSWINIKFLYGQTVFPHYSENYKLNFQFGLCFHSSHSFSRKKKVSYLWTVWLTSETGFSYVQGRKAKYLTVLSPSLKGTLSSFCLIHHSKQKGKMSRLGAAYVVYSEGCKERAPPKNTPHSCHDMMSEIPPWGFISFAHRVDSWYSRTECKDLRIWNTWCHHLISASQHGAND